MSESTEPLDGDRSSSNTEPSNNTEPSSNTEPLDSTATTSSASRRRAIAVAGGGVVAAAVVVALLLGGGDDRDDPTGAAPTGSSPTSTASPSASPSPSASAGEPTPTPGAGSPSPTTEPAPAEEAPAAESLVPLPPLTSEPPVVVPLDAPAEVGPSVTARLVGLEDVTATGTGPGEISGPAYLVTVEVTGSGTEPVDLSTVAVAAYLGTEGTPASPVLTEERSAPLSGTVEPGASVRGTYVFAAPPEQRALLSVTVLVGLDARMVVFQGDPANRPG